MNLLPRWIWLPFGVVVALVTLPLIGLLFRVPWSRLAELLCSPQSVDALRLSLLTCVASTLLVVTFGAPTAVLLARMKGNWAGLVRAVITVPMVLPPVVGGLALLVTFGRRGLVGAPLSSLAGIEIGFSTIAVIIAQTFVAMPFLIVSLEGALRTARGGYEFIAASLGAAPTRVLFRVTLPRLAPAILSGTALAFARALGEFGATLTFAGSLQGTTRTLPLEIYLLRESDSDLAIALAMVLVVIALLVVVLATRLRAWGDHE